MWYFEKHIRNYFTHLHPYKSFYWKAKQSHHPQKNTHTTGLLYKICIILIQFVKDISSPLAPIVTI